MKKIYFLLLTLLISIGSFGQTTVFINEIHYDNANGATGDIDEGFEIAGPATTDLTGWSVVLYNGNGNSSYNTIALSGIIADQQSGYGTIWFGLPQNGMQNGSPDGLALIAADGSTVIQFLSYEGSMTAGNGPAMGLTSTDIGVTESGSTPAGQSLQLSGSGSTYEDFVWSAPAAHSRDSVNISQTFGAAAPTINANPTSVSGLFYFEGNAPSSEGTFDASGVNLIGDITISAPTNFEISTTSGTGFSSSILLEQAAGIVATTTIYVRMIAGLTSNSYTGDIDLDSSGAGSKTVSLSGLVSPADPFITVNGGIGSMSYNFGGGPSAQESFGVEGMFLTTDITVTAPANFEVSLSEMSGYMGSVTLPQSEGTVENTTVYVRLSSGLAVGNYMGDITISSAPATDQIVSANGDVFPTATCAAAGDLVITEIMQNPSQNGDPAGEYFEIYNNSASAIDMVGWIIKDDLSPTETHTITSSLVVPPNGYIVIANGATPNGGLTPDYTYANDISLGNGDDGIIIECSSTIIDQVIWDDGATFPDPSGASMELSSTLPSTRNNVDNDDGANWGEAVTAFGDGDLGTPGGANDFTLANDDFSSNSFYVYPNPTSTGFVNIRTNSGNNVDVQVFNVLGKRVLNQSLSNERLDVSALKTGVYIIKISQNSNIATKKLVIK